MIQKFKNTKYILSIDKIYAIILHQELMIVWIQNYTYYVPFVMTNEGIFLKNIIPSRKYHKQYSKE